MLWSVIEEELELMPKKSVSLVILLLLDLSVSLGLVEVFFVALPLFFFRQSAWMWPLLPQLRLVNSLWARLLAGLMKIYCYLERHSILPLPFNMKKNPSRT